jgi:hypothetical protein
VDDVFNTFNWPWQVRQPFYIEGVRPFEGEGCEWTTTRSEGEMKVMELEHVSSGPRGDESRSDYVA